MILDTTKEIQEKKIAEKKEPSHAMFIEVSQALKDKGITLETLRKELNRLFKEDKIEVGSTLNSKYIKTK
ncbi:MAG: hypothetical protein GX963_09935 [Bacteroidales bacterium]|nr:hypothetical protein [Bacteroidales bacterium]